MFRTKKWQYTSCLSRTRQSTGRRAGSWFTLDVSSFQLVALTAWYVNMYVYRHIYEMILENGCISFLHFLAYLLKIENFKNNHNNNRCNQWQTRQ